MQALKKRNIANGKQFDHLFPKPQGIREVIKKNASVWDTINFMPKAAEMGMKDVKGIADVLVGTTLKESCENLWHFVYDHIQYKPDTFGIEEVRSPSELWATRSVGGDCDCFSTFIASVLAVWEVPQIIFRITKYPSQEAGKKPKWSHVYIIVPTSKNQHITIDCVADQFDYEVPYIEKHDKIMDLHYLHGLPDHESHQQEDELQFDFDFDVETEHTGVDAADLLDGSDDLGLLRLRRRRSSGTKKKPRKTLRDRFNNTVKKVAKVAGKGLHAINRINPAAAALRLGVLASMKINLMKVAETLRYAYLSPGQAKKMGVDMAKFPKLQKIRLRAEQIFHKAGGKPKNLKAAILKGKGNRDKKVPLISTSTSTSSIKFDPRTRRFTPLRGLETEVQDAYNSPIPVSEIIGDDLYFDEVEMNGLNGLGAVETGAAITAATGAMSALAALIKALGSILKKSPSAPDSAPLTEAPLNESQFIPEDYEGDDYSIPDVNLDDLTKFMPAPMSKDASAGSTAQPSQVMARGGDSTLLPDTTLPTQLEPNAEGQDGSDAGSDADAEPEEGSLAAMWKEHKAWFITGGLLLAAGGGYLLYRASQDDDKEDDSKDKDSKATVSGLPKKQRKSYSKSKPSKGKSKTKKARFTPLK